MTSSSDSETRRCEFAKGSNQGRDIATARVKEALVLHKSGRTQAAEEIYNQVLKDVPDHPDALHLLGLVYHDRKNFDEAERLIRAALRFAPNQAPLHHNLASVLSVKGKLAEAEGHYREAIRIKPDYAEAIYNLSAIIRPKYLDPLVEQANALLDQTSLNEIDRCFLHFAVGKLLDDAGQFEPAFAHFEHANNLKGEKYDPERVEDTFRQTKEAMDKDLLAQLAQRGLANTIPVFVVGMPRSGTSLLEQMLSNHPDIFGAGELPDISAMARSLSRHTENGEQYPASFRAVDQQVLNGMGRAYLKKLLELSPDSLRVINKMPTNFWHLGLIAAVFPKARIIHCKRNPMDTCLSCYFQNFTRGNECSFSLRNLAHYYKVYCALMAHWRSVLPMPMLEFNYEDLVSRKEDVSKEIVAFLGLKWDPRCGVPEQSNRSVDTASRWQVRQPVYETSVGRWRNYESHLTELKEALAQAKLL